MRKLMLLVAVLGFSNLLWAAEPIVGTWKVNASKSKLAPVGGWVKETRMTFREFGDQLLVEINGTMINGTPYSSKGNRPLVGGIVKSEPPSAEGTVDYVTVIGPGDAYVTTLQNGKQTVWTIMLSAKMGRL